MLERVAEVGDDRQEPALEGNRRREVGPRLENRVPSALGGIEQIAGVARQDTRIRHRLVIMVA